MFVSLWAAVGKLHWVVKWSRWSWLILIILILKQLWVIFSFMWLSRKSAETSWFHSGRSGVVYFSDSLLFFIFWTVKFKPQLELQLWSWDFPKKYMNETPPWNIFTVKLRITRHSWMWLCKWNWKEYHLLPEDLYSETETHLNWMSQTSEWKLFTVKLRLSKNRWGDSRVDRIHCDTKTRYELNSQQWIQDSWESGQNYFQWSCGSWKHFTPLQKALTVNLRSPPLWMESIKCESGTNQSQMKLTLQREALTVNLETYECIYCEAKTHYKKVNVTLLQKHITVKLRPRRNVFYSSLLSGFLSWNW